MQDVLSVLNALTDPEIPVITLEEMGIIRSVTMQADGTLDIVITPTYSGCPAMEQISEDVHRAVHELGLSVRLRTQLDPAWTTDWMSDVAKDKLRAYGIAPPNKKCSTSGARETVLQFIQKPMANLESVPCPQCASEDTVETSRFGSTACKALYKCLNCSEPFDYFKPY